MHALLLALLTACTPDVDPVASLDARYAEIRRDLGVADVDTTRNVRNREARARKVKAEQARVAFFADPDVRMSIDEARKSADPKTRWAGDHYWREAILHRSWTEEEKARETELLARIEEQRTRPASWTSADGATEIALNGRWPNVSREADKLSAEQRRALADTWADQQVSWMGEDFTALLRLRNEVARREGFNTYWELALAHDGLDPVSVKALLDELEALLVPINEANVSKLVEAARAEQVEFEFANEPMLRRKAGLALEQADADAWFDTDLVEERLATAFADLGLPIDGLRISIGPSRYTRPGAYSFIIRPPDSADVIISNDERFALWPYRALLHEVGMATWWRNLNAEQIASPIAWEPADPWFEGYGQLYERMLFEPAFLERYVPELPAELRPKIEAFRVSSTVETLTWYLGAARMEQALYERPQQVREVAAEAAALEARLRAWPFSAPEGSSGVSSTALLQSGLMLNYPGYVQNFLYGAVVEANLWEAAKQAVGDPVANPKLGPWVVDQLVHTVGPGQEFPARLETLSGGRGRTDALAAYLKE